MSKRLWLSIGVIVLLAGGWLGYRHWRPPGRTVGSLVPPGALLVLASNQLQDTVSARTLRTEISLRQLPVFNEARQRLDRFLYAAADTATVLTFITGKNVRYSLHALSKNTLDLIFYVPIGPDDRSFVSRLTNPDPRRYRVLNHTFAGEKILDLVARGNEPVGSFILTDNVLVGSVSGILIENVAKRMHQPLTRPQPDPGSQIDADHGAGLSVRPEILQSLFTNSGSLIRLFLPERLTLRFRPSASRLQLIGYAASDIGNRRDVAALFAGQTPRRVAHADLIPQTTATLYHIGINDAGRFGRSMSILLGSASSDFLRDRFSQIAPATGALYRALDSDILLCRMESPTDSPRQVLVLSGRDARPLANAYQQIAYRAGAKAASPKTFLGHKVLLLSVPELPASLFSSLFSGFPQSWITQHNSALVVANSEEAMQDYLQQVQRGDVWSADERQADLLNSTLRPANFTAFVRLNRASTTVSANWPLAWQNLLDHHDLADISQTVGDGPTEPNRRAGGPALANLENMAYQASYGNEKILSTIVLGRTTRRASRAVLNKVLLQKKTELDAPLVATPIVTGSLSDGPVQFYAQSDAGPFVLVTPDGDRVVQDNPDGPIRSNALAVDFLDNGRLQYLFMTDRTLYVADPVLVRPGSKKNPLLAIRLPKGLDPTFLVRPRGMQQRNVVALTVHPDGHIYALDRQRRAFVRLMAAPRKGPLLLPFQIIPTPSGMNVLAAQPDGTVNYWRENGTQYPHFPARIERRTPEEPETRLAGPALLPPGQPDIQTITDEGQLLTMNTNGLITKRTQLFRPVRSGSFRLFPDEEQSTWLLLLTTDTEVAVLDQRGQRRFEVRALQSGPSSPGLESPGRNSIRYHRLGAGVELISVQSGGFTTFYDLNGRIIGDRPIPGDFPVTLQFDERTNELYVLSGKGKAVQLFSIRLR